MTVYIGCLRKRDSKPWDWMRHGLSTAFCLWSGLAQVFISHRGDGGDPLVEDKADPELAGLLFSSRRNCRLSLGFMQRQRTKLVGLVLLLSLRLGEIVPGLLALPRDTVTRLFQRDLTAHDPNRGNLTKSPKRQLPQGYPRGGYPKTIPFVQNPLQRPVPETRNHGSGGASMIMKRRAFRTSQCLQTQDINQSTMRLVSPALVRRSRKPLRIELNADGQ